MYKFRKCFHKYFKVIRISDLVWVKARIYKNIAFSDENIAVLSENIALLDEDHLSIVEKIESVDCIIICVFR